jgi:hypothetical protein
LILPARREVRSGILVRGPGHARPDGPVADEEDSMFAPLAAVVLSVGVVAAAGARQEAALDNEGFIRSWLVLAPIPIDGESGATEIEREFMSGEASLRPKPGEPATVSLHTLKWTAHTTPDYFIDFLQAFGQGRGEYVAGYAVTYITVDKETPATLALSTNDQGKVWLNGKPVFTFAETRTLEKDADRVPVTLAQGQNVLVLKVINEVNNWQACARFLGADGKPLTNIRVSSTPQ